MSVEFESSEGDVRSIHRSVLNSFSEETYLSMLDRRAGDESPVKTGLCTHDLEVVIVMMELKFYPIIYNTKYLGVRPSEDFNESFEILADSMCIHEVCASGDPDDEEDFVDYFHPELIERDAPYELFTEDEERERFYSGGVYESTDTDGFFEPPVFGENTDNEDTFEEDACPL
jgi:hypothetical protein